MKSLCVFCGSSIGNNGKFVEAAQKLGEVLATEKIRLVYGGGKIGLMGKLADACLDAGGEVTGIIPKFLAKSEIAHDGVTELIEVTSMHERKLKMSEMAEGFIALPGGYGTLEEFCEILTWVQLNLISKPIGILNVDGFYDNLLTQFHTMTEAGLLKQSNLKFFVVENTVEVLMNKMAYLSVEIHQLKDKFIHS